MDGSSSLAELAWPSMWSVELRMPAADTSWQVGKLQGWQTLGDRAQVKILPAHVGLGTPYT